MSGKMEAAYQYKRSMPQDAVVVGVVWTRDGAVLCCAVLCAVLDES